MTLTLRIRPFERLAPGQPAQHTLEQGRLSIGRGSDNDWVLPDPQRTISKHHCVIEAAADGQWVIDTSTNGVFLNDSDQPIGPAGRQALRHGDRIRIGDFEIRAEVAEAPDPLFRPLPAAPPSNPVEPPAFGLGHDFTSVDSLFGDDAPRAGFGPPESLPNHGGVPDSIFEDLPPPPSRSGPLRDLEQGAPVDALFEPPRGAVPPAGSPPPQPSSPPAMPAAPPPVAAEDLDDLFPPVSGQPVPPPPAAAPVSPPDDLEDVFGPEPAIGSVPSPPPAAAITPPPAPPEPGPLPPAAAPPPIPVPQPAAPPPDLGRVLAAFFAGARLDPASVLVEQPEAKLRQLGEIFRLVVEGVMEVLESRRAIKSEFRLGGTEFRAAENNPLKFSVDAESAMIEFLGQPRRGYLGAKEAFSEAFTDIRMHQVAVLAGMQQAWADLLRRFDPKVVEQLVGDDSGLSGLLASRKARLWDAFVMRYQSIVGDAENEYRRMFEQVFAEAYERHIDRQKQQGR